MSVYLVCPSSNALWICLFLHPPSTKKGDYKTRCRLQIHNAKKLYSIRVFIHERWWSSKKNENNAKYFYCICRLLILLRFYEGGVMNVGMSFQLEILFLI